MKYFGFTVQNVYRRAKSLLKKHQLMEVDIPDDGVIG